MARRLTGHYVCRLVPPRPTFHLDMDDRERAVMDRHAQYWAGLVERGVIVVYGPVLLDGASWDLGVLHADSEDEARALVEADPAVSSGTLTPEMGTMPVTVLPD